MDRMVSHRTTACRIYWGLRPGHDFGCSCHGVSDVAVLPRETKCDAVESAIEVQNSGDFGIVNP